MTNNFDTLLPRTTLQAKAGATVNASITYGYDGASRLQSVTDGTNNATYAYIANSPLVSQITLKSNATTRLTIAKSYDYLNRLSFISSAPSGASALTFGSAYNDVNQRVQVTLADGSFWVYEYDSLGQVRTGKKYWPDWTPVAGQQFEYAHDDIGNRSSTKAGGDEKGLNLRSADYSVNDLNQYTNRTVPGGVDIVGVANAPAVVTVNNQATYRHTEYYRKELSITNTAAPQYVGATNKAGQSGTTNTITGNVFLPKTPEVFVYDADGNLLSDGRWTNSWDAENRLISMQGLSTLPTAARQQLDFEYDWMSRRIRKTVSNWSVNKFVPAFTNRFVYDGWNLLVEANPSNVTQRRYIWGLDLSGSERGAGGVGGLLAMQDVVGNNGVQFAAYDLNGNIAALVRATNGAVSAAYEYGPFGELIRANGALARTNTFRFSTKYQDDESDMLYYGYRYLSTSTGRWLNRDQLREEGGDNLYNFCGNDGIRCFDFLGLVWKVERKGRERAIAIPQNGDTVSDLAKIIHLDDKDFQKWLKPVGPSVVPGSATESIRTCAQFTVPNTVFVDIGYRITSPWYLRYVDRINGTFTFLTAMAQATGNLYEQRGFNVVRTKPASGTDIRNHLSSLNIYAYVFAGHGSSGAIDSTEDDAVFPQRYTEYGIQYMGLLACGSAIDSTGENMNVYPSNVARRGLFQGSINNYTALLAIMTGFGDLVWVSTAGTN